MSSGREVPQEPLCAVMASATASVGGTAKTVTHLLTFCARRTVYPRPAYKAPYSPYTRASGQSFVNWPVTALTT